MVLPVTLQVAGKMVDPLGQQGDLNVRRAGVTGMQLVVQDDLLLRSFPLWLLGFVSGFEFRISDLCPLRRMVLSSMRLSRSAREFSLERRAGDA